MKARKKPVEIEFEHYTGGEESWKKCTSFVGDIILGENDTYNSAFGIPTLEGIMTVSIGDYIIKGIKGEFYPCKPDIFLATYEIIDNGE